MTEFELDLFFGPAEAIGLEFLELEGDELSEHAFAKFHRTTMEKASGELDGYLRALRRLPSNGERRALLAGYDKTIQPMLREILEEEGLL